MSIIYSVADSEVVTGGSKYLTVMWVFAAIGYIAFLAHVYYAVKVLMQYKLRSPFLAMFIIMLGISLLANAVYGTYLAIDRANDGTNVNNTCFDNWLEHMNMVSYVLTVLVNLFNLIYQSRRLDERITGELKNNLCLYFIFSCIFLLILMVYVTTMSVAGFKNLNYGDIINSNGFFLGAGGVFISISFIVFGKLFYSKFKKLFFHLAETIKIRIFLSISVVFVTFQIRGWFIIIVRAYGRFMMDWRNESLAENTIGFPIFIFLYYFFLSFIPSLVQIYMLKSLLFNNKSRVTPSMSVRTETLDFWDLVEDTNNTLEPSKEEKEP